MSDTQTRDRLLALVRRFSNDLEAGNADAERRMREAWFVAYDGARRRLSVLLSLVEAARAEGTPIDRAWLVRIGRMEDVIRVARAELRTYTRYAAILTTIRQEAAQAAAAADTLTLVRGALAQAPAYASAALGVNPANLATVVGLLSDGSPLAAHLQRTLADDAADALRQTLTRGITQGQGVGALVDDFTRQVATTHTRATTIMRTEALRVYRETSRATYEANPQTIKGWTWVSALDRRTCPACAVMHGTTHPPAEILDGHPRCRCAMAPLTVSYADLGLAGLEDPAPVPLGTAWIESMPPAQRRAYLGPAKYDALEAGRISLPDLVARRDDPRWGSMRTERSLASILAGRNANYGGL